MNKLNIRTGTLMTLLLALSLHTNAQTLKMPDVMTVRERAAVLNRITLQRLETLLPTVLEETGFDMWIIACNEDNLDPVFRTMIPYDTWCPITQILVFTRKGQSVERLNLSRTPMQGLHQDAWDYRAWDSEKKESQWDSLKRIVRERDPQRIAINEAETIWAADGLTATLKNRLTKTLGPRYSGRLFSAEEPATLWLETLLDEELGLYERVCAVAHALIAETFSDKVITPGVTTTDDLLYHYLQRVADLGMERYGWPWFRVRARDPKVLEKYGMDDPVIRRGDLLQCDAGIQYLRYYTDHAEWGYVLRTGETEVPGYYQRLLAEANRLQDIFCAEFKAGLTGNQILANILKSAAAAGICKPKIYSHSIGYFLHEPGPLIGLPWEQVDTGARGKVKLVPNSTFTAELSVTCPVPEFEGREMRFSLEEVVAFTPEGAQFLDGRQKKIYKVK
jgi:hypothetical protein